jgi:Kef-type K+ transport system membrane component KefB
MFLSALGTSIIGIFAIFGGFMFGAILYDQHELRNAIKQRMQDFVTVFFLPIFFTYTGLRTDLWCVIGPSMWLFCALILIAAITGKLGGCTIAARLSGIPTRESLIIGVMMNTRGLMELIVVNIGYDLGIIPRPAFFMLVLMAVVTTYITTPILRRLLPGTEMWEPYKISSLATA